MISPKAAKEIVDAANQVLQLQIDDAEADLDLLAEIYHAGCQHVWGRQTSFGTSCIICGSVKEAKNE